MNVTRDVILDLLPLHLAGEASPATRALVEEYLQGDPDLARQVRESQGALLAATPGEGPPPGSEMRTLRRTQRALARQRWLFGIGLMCIGVSLSTEITMRGGWPVAARMLAQDAPLQAALMFVSGVACLVVYHRIRR